MRRRVSHWQHRHRGHRHGCWDFPSSLLWSWSARTAYGVFLCGLFSSSGAWAARAAEMAWRLPWGPGASRCGLFSSAWAARAAGLAWGLSGGPGASLSGLSSSSGAWAARAAETGSWREGGSAPVARSTAVRRCVLLQWGAAPLCGCNHDTSVGLLVAGVAKSTFVPWGEVVHFS